MSYKINIDMTFMSYRVRKQGCDVKNKKMFDLRTKKGLSQVEVAKQAGISTRQYQRVEAGEHLPNVAPAIKIAKLLGTTVEELFT